MLDASAIIAYLRDESGADTVEKLLANDDELCMAHAINLCETYYKMSRHTDESEVRTALRDFSGKVVVRADLNQPFWLQVSEYKAQMRSTPLADCFVVALANREDAEAITADYEDFEPIKAQGICRVTFIRPKRQKPGSAS